MEKELQKQMVRRNLVFWGKVAEKYVITTVGIIVGYMLFFGWIEGKNIFMTNEIWSTFFIYQLMLVLISSLVAPGSYGMIYIPLVISFGSKRNEAVWGFQLMNWLIIGEMGALLILFACLSSMNSEQLLLIAILVLGGGIVGIALGQFAVALGFRFGRKGLLTAVLVFAILLTVVGVIITLFVVRRNEIAIEWYWVWMEIGLAVVLYLGSLFVLLQMVQNYEVRG